jgi:hypothetical protein
MNAIRNQEYRSQIHKQYVNDSYLRALNQLHINLVETACPKIIVTDEGIQRIYDKVVQDKIDKIISERIEYIKRYYPSLL